MSRLAPRSLRTRVVVAGLAVLTCALLAAGSAVWLLQRAELDRHLDEVLTERAEVVLDYAELTTDPSALAELLAARGIRAVVVGPDGARHATDPAFPRVDTNLPVPPDTDRIQLRTRTVDLPDGGHAEVSVSRDGVDAVLDRLLRWGLLTAIVALPLAAALLTVVARRALRPLDELVATANDIADGDLDRRVDRTDTTTELGRTAAAFDRMLDEVQTALDQARDAERTTREFLGDSAHQLKTPITSASLSVQTLLHETCPQRREDLLLIARRETDRAGRMVHGLLRLAHLDHGQTLTTTACDLGDVLTDEHARAARRAVHLEVARDLHGPLRAVADPHAVAEIVANLLDNAGRYATARIALTATTVGDHLVVTVHDDGPGVAAADAEAIFDRFVTRGERGGDGLGLAVARGLARAMGGEVAWNGRAFVLTLPAAPAPPGPGWAVGRLLVPDDIDDPARDEPLWYASDG